MGILARYMILPQKKFYNSDNAVTLEIATGESKRGVKQVISHSTEPGTRKSACSKVIESKAASLCILDNIQIHNSQRSLCRYSNMARGFQDKLLYLVLFSLYSSFFWI